MKIGLPIIFLTLEFVATSALHVYADEYKTFTNNEFRKIVAKPVDVVGKQFKIQLRDGREFTIDKSILIEKDQIFLLEWACDYLANQQRLLKISAEPAFDSNQPLPLDDKTPPDAEPEITTPSNKSPSGYTVAISNLSELELNDLTVDYILISKKNHLQEGNHQSHSYSGKIGKETIEHLSGKGNYTFTTDTIAAGNFENPEKVAPSKAQEVLNDRLAGIQVKILKNDKLICTYITPPDLFESLRNDQ